MHGMCTAGPPPWCCLYTVPGIAHESCFMYVLVIDVLPLLYSVVCMNCSPGVETAVGTGSRTLGVVLGRPPPHPPTKSPTHPPHGAMV
jgi:hypothetical protein